MKESKRGISGEVDTHLPCILKVVGLNLGQVIHFMSVFLPEVSRIVVGDARVCALRNNLCRQWAISVETDQVI
uniref:Uncharacterized protein n=1 Tax=Arion vulgaris TaxID=1028688 RepID=A0A0B6ZRE7_9EUPU